jgi:hypothetical protein
VKVREELEQFEKLIGQLRGLHEEVGLLAKKSPNDAVNAFKLRLVNKVVASANVVLGPNYLPFDDFQAFDTDDMPTNSDVALVLAQYLEESERFRSDNVQKDRGVWWYVVGGELSDVRTSAPAKVIGK